MCRACMPRGWAGWPNSAAVMLVTAAMPSTGPVQCIYRRNPAPKRKPGNTHGVPGSSRASGALACFCLKAGNSDRRVRRGRVAGNVVRTVGGVIRRVIRLALSLALELFFFFAFFRKLFLALFVRVIGSCHCVLS